MNLADDGAAGDARAERACDQGSAHAACPKFFELLDPLLDPDRFDRVESGRHANSNSLIRSLWEALGQAFYTNVCEGLPVKQLK